MLVTIVGEAIKGDEVDEGKKNEPIENSNPQQEQATKGQRGDT